MASTVVCPKCNAVSSGYFCECGNDLREAFGALPPPPPREERAPRRASPPNPAGMMLESAPTRGLSADGSARVMYGVFLLVIGVAVTGGSYLLAGPGGGYTVAFGAIGVGLWKIVTGLGDRT